MKMNIHKSDHFNEKNSGRKNKKKSVARLQMLMEKVSNLNDAQVLLEKSIPENLQNFCKIADITQSSILIFVYPAIYLRQIKAAEKQILQKIHNEFAERFTHINSIECKVRPLDLVKNTQAKQDKTEVLKNNSDEIKEIPQKIKNAILNVANETQDPNLKKQLEKMANLKN